MKKYPNSMNILAILLCMSYYLLAEQVFAESIDGELVVNSRCIPCHVSLPNGGLSRISEIRKTPEGWYMSFFRMEHNYNVKLTKEERDSAIKYLSDKQGLAPDETRDFRYILERIPSYVEKYNAVDKRDPDGIAVSCTNCHSFARIALQRRDKSEWFNLINFHVGQYPAIEFQMFHRDREYWKEISSRLPEVLASKYPYNTQEWQAWGKVRKVDLTGEWRLTGHLPGTGFYSGINRIKRVADDEYETSFSLDYADGRSEQGTGKAIVYTGFEWRGSTEYKSYEVREVYKVVKNGNEISGRWFRVEQDELGGRMRAVRIRPGYSEVMGMHPSYIRAGETARIEIHGTGLVKKIDFGPGIESRIISSNTNTIVAEISASKRIQIGARSIKVGKVKSLPNFVVYRNIDSIRVEPEYYVARLGDGGGKIPPVPAQFEAIAYLNGDDGKFGTKDDIRIGAMPAKWQLEPYDDVAKEWEDHKYAGRITTMGLFLPSAAGINPVRSNTPNNTGNLSVRAKVRDGESVIEGRSHLIVTMALKWVNPPIY